MVTHDTNLINVLENDGIKEVIIGDLENLSTTNVDDLREKMGSGSWAVRIIYNELFGGVLIHQRPGEKTRQVIGSATALGLLKVVTGFRGGEWQGPQQEAEVFKDDGQRWLFPANHHTEIDLPQSQVADCLQEWVKPQLFEPPPRFFDPAYAIGDIAF